MGHSPAGAGADALAVRDDRNRRASGEGMGAGDQGIEASFPRRAAHRPPFDRAQDVETAFRRRAVHPHRHRLPADEDQWLVPPPFAETGQCLPIVRLALLVRLGGQARNREPGFNKGGHAETAQFSSCRPRTLENSRVLLVTRTALTLSACAAIRVSREPIGSPRRSRSARKSP